MIPLYYFMIGTIMFIALWMSRKVEVDEEITMSGTAVYKWYVVGLILLASPFFVVIWTLNVNEPQPLFGLSLALFFGYRALMESKHIRESNRHLVSLAVAVTALIFACLLVILRMF